MGGRRQVSIESHRCKGCEACSDMLPEVFGWDPEAERVYLRQGTAPEDDLARCVNLCPARCIEMGDPADPEPNASDPNAL